MNPACFIGDGHSVGFPTLSNLLKVYLWTVFLRRLARLTIAKNRQDSATEYLTESTGCDLRGVMLVQDSKNMVRVFSGSNQNRRLTSLAAPLNKERLFVSNLVFGPNGWQKRPQPNVAIRKRDPRKQWTVAEQANNHLARSRKGLCR